MSFDGETIKDGEAATIEEADEIINNWGSKWIYYPYPIIIKGQTVKRIYGTFYNTKTGENIVNKLFAGKRLKTIKRLFKLAFDTHISPEEFETNLIDLIR